MLPTFGTFGKRHYDTISQMVFLFVSHKGAKDTKMDPAWVPLPLKT